MSTPCIRRAHTFWTTCPCDDCRVDRRRKAKLARTIGVTRVSSEDAWKAIDHLVRRGWTGQAIASATGVSRRSVEGALTELRVHGRRTLFGPTTTARLIAYGHPTAGQVGAYAARRRLQGLAVQGWDVRLLAARYGIGESTIASIRAGGTDRIGVHMNDRVTAATADIGMAIGPSVQARQNADRKGWVGLLAWNDIDDPDERPAPSIAGRRSEDSVDEVVVQRVLETRTRPRKLTNAESAELARRLRAAGASERVIEKQYGLKPTRYQPKDVA